MKSTCIKLFMVILLVMVSSLVTNAQNNQIDKTYIGKWSFDAPSAPSGYTYGIMEIRKDSVITTFSDGSYEYRSNWIKVKSDSLIYEVNIDGEDVLFSLKIKDKDDINGDAVWSGGETKIIIKNKL